MAEFILRLTVREYLDLLDRALKGEGKNDAACLAVGRHAKKLVTEHMATKVHATADVIEVPLPEGVSLSVLQSVTKR